MQLDLLAGVPLREIHRAEGERAGIACLDKAETAVGFDSAGAAQFILNLLASGGPTPGEVLTDTCVSAGFKPHDTRAFGPIYAALVRRKAIKCIGFCERTKGNGTAGGRIWSAA